jgi:hypothetical protein
LIANQQKELCFLGLVSMGSRVYKTIPSAIERCKLANIRIIMVSQVQLPVRAASPWRPTNGFLLLNNRQTQNEPPHTHQDPAPAVKVVARKMGLITKETPEDIAKKEGVMVDELSPEKLEQAKAIVLDGSQMALMMEEGLSHIMRTHDEVVISGYACPFALCNSSTSRLMRRVLLSFVLLSLFPERTPARSSRSSERPR